MIDSSSSDDGQWSEEREWKKDDDEGLMKLFSSRLSARDWAVFVQKCFSSKAVTMAAFENCALKFYQKNWKRKREK